MAKIDRLGWAEGLAVRAYGLRIGVRVNRPDALTPLVERLPPGWKPSSSPVVDRLYSLWLGKESGSLRGPRGYHLLYVGAVRCARSLSVDEVLDAFESELRQAVAALSRDRVFIHAGVVGWGGGAILLPGRSCSGKTRLVRALVRAGASYYSDEFAVLDRRGRVHPFGHPLSIREGAGVHRCSPEELGGVRGVGALPVRAIVLTGYRAGARWRPLRLTPGQAVLALLAHAVPVRRRPRTVLRTLQKAVSGAVALKGVRGGAVVTAPAVLARLALEAEAVARAS